MIKEYKIIYTDEVCDATTSQEAAKTAFETIQGTDGINFEIIDLETGVSEMIYYEEESKY